jgi:purine-binding chemotaxis protein CheW
MSLNAAAEHLKTLQAAQQADSERSGRAQQEEIVYHQWATFRVDNELYGIDVMKVKEVLRFTEITPVPGADTRRLFGLPPVPYDDNTRVIVVEFNEQEVIGLVVDSGDEVISLPQDEVDRAPSVSGDDSTKRFVQGVCYHNNTLIILLDLEKMLASITPVREEEL